MRKLSFAVGLLVIAAITALSWRGLTLSHSSRGEPRSMHLAGAASARGLPQRFRYLAAQKTNTCGLQPDGVRAYPGSRRLQGSCCFPMDMQAYQHKVEELKRYRAIPQIPRDPYDIRASLAQKLLGYQKSIHLRSGQQRVYDDAMRMSREKGPCCCVCWRWYAFEGLGKYLVAERSWKSTELAHLIDLVDGCGGPDGNHGGGRATAA